MSEKKSFTWFLTLAVVLFVLFTAISAQGKEVPDKNPALERELAILKGIHAISSHTLMGYVEELCSGKFGGRLTGSPGYDASARYCVEIMKKWSVAPAINETSYLQEFPNPYTEVLDSGALILHLPCGPGKPEDIVDKHYRYELDYTPGSTSGAGTVKGEVVYAGYGITAPELDYDEYLGLDVAGRIVLVEREIPVSPNGDPEVFRKWRPYSFHDYKVANARKHGAAGMLYIYNIANPNCLYIPDLNLTHVGDAVVEDLFRGTGRDWKKTVESIGKTLTPQSFSTGKMVTMRNNTRHFPDAVGSNVVGMIRGSDPRLKEELIMLGAHLDHLGENPMLLPGANDNASGVAVLLGVAEAIRKSGLQPKRTIVFIFFGAEEQGVKGSEYYLNNPLFPHDRVKVLVNLDGVGRGDALGVLAGKNYPHLWKYFMSANDRYIHRPLETLEFLNRARPRLDAARFIWAGIPALSFYADGGEELPLPVYHKTGDNPAIITPEIMEDLAQLIFAAIMDMAEY